MNIIVVTRLWTQRSISQIFSSKAPNEYGGTFPIGLEAKTTGKILILSPKICSEYENSMNEIGKGWHT